MKNNSYFVSTRTHARARALQNLYANFGISLTFLLFIEMA